MSRERQDPPLFTTLRVGFDGPVGRLTLARPARLNALGRTSLRELAEAARWFDSQPGVKVVVVSGEGRAFCAGFDLHDFTTADDELSARQSADLGRLMAEAVAGMRAVTIAAVQGWCVGGGVVLTAACDLRLAADDATFSIPEIDLGIPLAWGGIPRLVRELGPAVTKELVLSCRPFDAEEARSFRFVNRIVPRASLEGGADEWASALSAKSALTLSVTKRQVNAAAEDSCSTAHAGTDADVLAAALADRESRDVASRYLSRQERSSS